MGRVHVMHSKPCLQYPLEIVMFTQFIGLQLVGLLYCVIRYTADSQSPKDIFRLPEVGVSEMQCVEILTHALIRMSDWFPTVRFTSQSN